MMASDGSYFEMALITLVTNARYLFDELRPQPAFRPGTPLCHRLLIGFDVTDELFRHHHRAARPFESVLYLWGL